ncbi:retrovirus-related pol polyprotein from transposon TNT 1-94 [Tanacetum coccineum]
MVRSCLWICSFTKEFKGDLLTYYGENETSKDFEDISESSNDNTNVVNAPRKPIVVNQDPGEKSSQGPPQIDQNCCYECGDSLDGIFCQQCICKFCGKGAHYGYNCPPKVPIISNPEQCNQTINELPQILPNVHPTCNYEDENSFISDSKPHSFNVSPSVFNQPPQPQFETYLCELCGNNAHYGYDCSSRVPFVYEQEPCYNQNFNDNYYPQNSPSFSQHYLCCAYCGGPHYDYQCQSINETYYEPNPSYDYSGFDHPQPPQDSVYCQEALDKILEELEEIKRDQRMLKELKKRIAEEQTAKENMSIEEMRHEQQLKLGLEVLTPTRMTLELANRSITHSMGIAEDVVVRVDGFSFLTDFVVVNFEPDPRVPIILGRPFLRTAKALIDLYEETLTLRHFVHAISVIDFSKDDPFSGSTTTQSDDPSPSSSPIKISDNFEKFADELDSLDLLPPGNDDSTLKKDLHEENFQVYSNPLFEFDDNFKSSTINPLFDEMKEDVEIKNSNVSDEPVLLNTPLSDKVECFTLEDYIDEIDAFLAMEVTSNVEEGYFDSEGDVTFLDNLLSNDVSYNLASEEISDHEPEQNESSITLSLRSDPLHHEFSGELLTLPSGNDREFEEYLSLITVLCEISTSQSQENIHANQSSVIESLPISPIPVEDSEPAQEEIDIFLVLDDLIPPGVENDDFEDEDHKLPNLDHQDDPSIPRPPPKPPDVEKCFEPEAGILITKVFKGVSKSHDFMADILPTLPTLVSDFPFILFLSLCLSFGSEDTVIDPTISEASRVRYGYIKNHKKTVKNRQTRIRETEEYKRAKDSKPKTGKGETSLKYSHWLLPTRRTHMDSEEYTRGSGICSKLSAKEAQCVTITDCQAGNPCELRYDPTAHRWHPKIE